MYIIEGRDVKFTKLGGLMEGGSSGSVKSLPINNYSKLFLVIIIFNVKVTGPNSLKMVRWVIKRRKGREVGNQI